MNKGFSFLPDDALAASVANLLAAIPSEVLEVWKSTIVDHLTNEKSTFSEEVLLSALAKRMGLEATRASASLWLKAVNIFRMQGWKVERLDEPSTFVFYHEQSAQPAWQQQQYPVSPACVAACAAVTKVNGIPLEVITVWNKLIIENYANGQSKVDYDAIAGAIAYHTGRPVSEVHRSNWLSIFSVYEKQGWSVKFGNRAYIFTEQSN